MAELANTEGYDEV
jgi:hypothetical protein